MYPLLDCNNINKCCYTRLCQYVWSKHSSFHHLLDFHLFNPFLPCHLWFSTVNLGTIGPFTGWTSIFPLSWDFPFFFLVRFAGDFLGFFWLPLDYTLTSFASLWRLATYLATSSDWVSLLSTEIRFATCSYCRIHCALWRLIFSVCAALATMALTSTFEWHSLFHIFFCLLSHLS